MFVDMVRHRRCDRAIASWLFWSSDPATSSGGKRPPAESVAGAVSNRSERGGFNNTRDSATTGLKWRFRRARGRSAHRLDGPPPFRIPRDCAQALRARNPDLPAFDETTERDLKEMFSTSTEDFRGPTRNRGNGTGVAAIGGSSRRFSSLPRGGHRPYVGRPGIDRLWRTPFELTRIEAARIKANARGRRESAGAFEKSAGAP